MRRGPVALIVALFVALAGIVPAPAATREKKARPDPPDNSTLIEHATVEMVLIETYVTDGQGRPIEGLGPDDFVLIVDGRVRPISSLEYRDAGAPSTTASGGTAPVAPGLEPPTPRVTKFPRRFILFYEDGTSAPNGLAAARRATERLLAEGFVPEDQVALAVYDRGLRLLHDFTSDREALRRSVEASLADPRRLANFSSEQTPLGGAFAGSIRGTRLNALSYAAEVGPRTRGALSALRTLVDSVSPYPGYKAIVFMGDGIPENSALDFMQRYPGSSSGLNLSELRSFDLSQAIHQLATAAAAANVTLHSVQTSGLTIGSPRDRRGSGRMSNALETIALNTGGTASTSNDLFKALSGAEVASRAFYLIGYAPEGPPDGRDHSVIVRVKKKSDARLRWRRGFTRLLADDAHEHALQAAYLLPELYGDLGVELTIIPGPLDGPDRLADLVIHLPPGRVLFVPAEGGPTARLEAGFVVIDAAKHATLRAAREVRVALRAGMGTTPPGLDFHSRIRMPRDGQTITAVVSDLSTGGLGAGRLAVPAAGTALRVVGLSVYSMAEKSVWVEIPTGPATDSSSEELAEYDLGPAVKSTFSIGEPVVCAFRLEGPATGPLRVLIRNDDRVVRSFAVETAGADEVPAPGSGRGSIKLGLAVDDLPEGDYVLAVQAHEGDSEGQDLATVPFRLRARSSDAGLPSGGGDS